MENIPVFSNRLDESNGIVENVLEMKAKKTPWHLRFAQKAKGLVSFVQNLLSPLTRKEGVRGGQLSAFFQSAAVAVIGIGLLVGSTGEVQAACDPPVFDVCTHKFSGSWSADGYFAVDIQFKGKSGKKYEVEWHGLKKLFVWEELNWVLITTPKATIRFMAVMNRLSRTRIFGGIKIRTATMAVPFTRGILKTANGFAVIGLPAWIFTLIKRRPTFPSTALLLALILNYPLITARLIGNLFLLR